MEKIDIYELFTSEELESITNIFLEAFSRKHGSVPDIFEIETNMIFD